MEALIVMLLLLLFSFFAYRYGHNSLPGIGSQGERLPCDGFQIDRETFSVGTVEPEPHSLTTLSAAGGVRAITSQAA